MVCHFGKPLPAFQSGCSPAVWSPACLTPAGRQAPAHQVYFTYAGVSITRLLNSFKPAKLAIIPIWYYF